MLQFKKKREHSREATASRAASSTQELKDELETETGGWGSGPSLAGADHKGALGEQTGHGKAPLNIAAAAAAVGGPCPGTASQKGQR